MATSTTTDFVLSNKAKEILELPYSLALPEPSAHFCSFDCPTFSHYPDSALQGWIARHNARVHDEDGFVDGDNKYWLWPNSAPLHYIYNPTSGKMLCCTSSEYSNIRHNALLGILNLAASLEWDGYDGGYDPYMAQEYKANFIHYWHFGSALHFQGEVVLFNFACPYNIPLLRSDLIDLYNAKLNEITNASNN
jgi:hypothetical protein